MPYLPTFQDEQEFDLEPIEKAIQGGVGLESSDEKLRIAVRALMQMRERISNIIETLKANKIPSNTNASGLKLDFNLVNKFLNALIKMYLKLSIPNTPPGSQI